MGFQEGIQDNHDFEGVLASIFGRLSKASERQKLGFRIGGVYKIRCFFGPVLGGSWGRFSELFGRFWVDFGALKRSPILKPKLEAEKVISETREGG